jgi:hypothetical protein
MKPLTFIPWSPLKYKEKSTISTAKTPKKAVSFARSTSRYSYPIDQAERLDFYSSADRKVFQTQVAQDAFHIKNLIESSPCKQGAAIRYLLERNLTSTEELIGIENMIHGAAKILKGRREHTEMVINVQRELTEKNEPNAWEKLAEVASALSRRNVEKARLLAGLAANK